MMNFFSKEFDIFEYFSEKLKVSISLETPMDKFMLKIVIILFFIR